MKLWQGWHNTDLGRSYFHYGPLGGTKKQMGILAQTCKKRGVKMHGEKSGKWKKAKWEGFFYLIVEKYVVILLFLFIEKQFLPSVIIQDSLFRIQLYFPLW